MSNRSHDHTHFFKYTSYETALRVIKSNSFRWSAPTKFNDPFDHQTGFIFTYNEDDLTLALSNEVERIIFSDDEPSFTPNSLFSALILMLREVRHKLPKNELIREIAEASRESAAKFHRSLVKLNDEVETVLCHSRIFCVTEKFDNIVMWSHYADEHKGAVFKLRCLDEIDNTLLAAKKVSYINSFVPFPNPQSFSKHLTGEKPIDFTQLMWDLAFTKHSDWSYEQEWRVHVGLLDEPAGNGYSIYSEHPSVFEAIYLGCNMETEAKEEIIRLAKQYLPHTKIFQGFKSKTSFSLMFSQIL